MKNRYLFAFFTFFVFALAMGFTSAAANSCSPVIKLVSQDPSPAVPGEYVKVIFEVSNLDNCDTGFAVKLNPEYPFSLDSNESAVQTIAVNPYALGYRAVWTIPYKIRVDSAAFDGDYGLKLGYHEGGDANSPFYAEQEFNLTLTDSRTKFDSVIQEISGNEISIAIANIGKYTANSVVVRIPEQDSFSASGTDGQMVGNLDSGDYTIVGFTIVSKGVVPQGMNQSRNGGMPQSNYSLTRQQSNQLKFDIYYTDNIGERRVVNLALPLKISSNSSALAGTAFARKTSSTTSSTSSGYKWIIILVILIVLYFVYRKNQERINQFAKKMFSKNKRFGEGKESSTSKIPDWVKNAKEKRK